jgi:proline iminopeptidase
MLRILLILLLLPLAVAASPRSSPPRQGYIQTPDGVRLFYKVRGHGPTKLVIVHGGPGNSLSSVLPDYAPFEKSFTLIYYDQRGGGRSDLIAEDGKLSLRHHIADLDAVRAHFGIERMNLMGNSWGGLLAAAYAGAHPDRIERLILQDSAPPTKAWMAEGADELTARARARLSPEQVRRYAQLFNPDYMAASPDPRAACLEWAAMLLPLMQADPARPLTLHGDVCDGTEEGVRQQQRTNRRIWRTLGDFDLRPPMAALNAPVLIIHGEADYLPLAGSRGWAAAIPNARLLVVPGAGHLAQGERPDIFFPAVEVFLKGGWPAGAVAVRPGS